MTLVCTRNAPPEGLGAVSYGLDPTAISGQWVEEARNAFAQLADSLSILGTLSYNFTIASPGTVAPYASPQPPTELSYAYDTPEDPFQETITAPPPFAIGTAPTFSETLVIDESGQPGAAPEPTFGDAPLVVMPEFPDDVSYTVPSVPTIDGIIIPNFLPIESVDPSITIPTFTVEDLSNQLTYTNNLWTSTDLDDMRSHMDRVRNGDFSITAIIWQQIFDRASMQLRKEAITRERAARRQWSKNGWMMPGGIALAGAQQAAQDINESTAMKALEVAVQEAVQKDEQFWKSMSQGVSIESLYNKAHAEYYERGLRFAIALQDAYLAIYQALIAKFNAEIAAAQMQIESKRLEIDNQRLKLEENKLVIEAALARGEADKLELQLYIAQWEGIKAAVDVYKAEVEAVKVNVDAQRANLEAHGLNIQQYKTLVDAWATEWQGYESKMKGEEAKAAVFDSLVKAYSARVAAYSAEIGGEEARVKSATEFAKLQQDTNRYELERFKTEWDAISSKLDATARQAQANASVFSSQVQGAVAKTNADVQIAGYNLDVAKVNQVGAIEAAKLSVAQLLEQAKLSQEAELALGNIYAQLVSATYSTINYSESRSNGMSYNYSDANSWVCS